MQCRALSARALSARALSARALSARALSTDQQHTTKAETAAAIGQSHFWVPHLAKLVLPEKIHKSFTENLDRAPRQRRQTTPPWHIAMPLPRVYVGLHENTHPSHRNHDRR